MSLPLRVASCPRCKGALVFGEQACRTCNQTFDYGPSAPPVPTYAQIVEALASVGLPAPAAPIASTPRAPVVPAQPSAPRPQAAAPATQMEGLDTGRHAETGDVEWQEVSGLMETAMFAAFTPKHVEAQAVFGFDGGRFEEANAPSIAAPAGLERTEQDDGGDPLISPVSGLFGSDIYNTSGVTVAPPPVDGLEASPSIARAAKRKSVKDSDLEKALCRCSEVHRLPRCPACGTPHPDRS